MTEEKGSCSQAAESERPLLASCPTIPQAQAWYIKHIAISLINDFYSTGKEFVIANELLGEKKEEHTEIEKQIISILESKIRPAVAKDGGDIKFKEFKDGIVKVELQGSCSGCPSSTMTLKQGVQNLLCHYLPEVKEVVAI